MDINLLTMAASIGTELQWLATTSALQSLPGELLGALVDRGLCAGWEKLRAGMRVEGPVLNHDFQRALRKSYLQATREMLEHALPFVPAGGITDERGLLHRAIKAIGEDLNQIESWMPASEVLPDAPALLLTGESAKERLANIHSAAAASLKTDLENWEPGSWNIGAVQSAWQNGWKVVGSDQSSDRSWMGAVAVYFNEAIKHNQPVANIFQSTMLAELQAAVQGIDRKLDQLPSLVADEIERRKPAAQPTAVRLLPPAPPTFAGRVEVLDWLEKQLAPGGRALLYGEPGTGKSTISQQVALQPHLPFQDVIYHHCGDRPVETIAGELLLRLGFDLTGISPATYAEKVRAWFAGRSALLILDDVWRDDAAGLLAASPLAVLVTSRQRHVLDFPIQDVRKVDGFLRDEVVSFFNQALDMARYAAELNALVDFGMEMEGHPYALAAAVGMLNRTTRPANKAVSFLKSRALQHGKLDLGKLLETAVAAQSKPARQLLRAFAVCIQAGAWLPFAAELTGMTEEQAQDAADELVSSSLLRVLDEGNQMFGMHALLHKALAPSAASEFQKRHAEVLGVWMPDWETELVRCGNVIEEALPAIQFLDRIGSGEDFGGLINSVFRLAYRTGRLTVALTAMEVSSNRAERFGNHGTLQASWGNQSLILRAWGRLDDAMALLKKQEALSEQFGDRAGLQASWGNQTPILKAWGRLDDAMALLKKQEAFSEQLGDRAGLQASWANQAMILTDWGRLDDAMALLKKQENVCEQLGYRDSLQTSWGNQGHILTSLGRLDEAMALLKKQEIVCEQLGDRDGLQRSWGDQAVILTAWSRLDDAMVLLKKNEAVCEQLGDRVGLGICFANQAKIHNLRKEPQLRREKLDRARALFSAVGMAAELAKTEALLRET